MLAALLFGAIALGTEPIDVDAAAPHAPEEAAEVVAARDRPTPGHSTKAPGQPLRTPTSTLVHALREAPNAPLHARMKLVSDAMLGARYLADPLGEGEAPDLDPLVRYDAFDCLTFVEEVLALSLTTHHAEADALRMRLRYGHSEPSYANRHHFMELQWLPAAVSNGLLVDRTASYGATQRHEQEVTPHIWKHWPSRARFAIPDDTLPTGPIALDVLPLSAAREHASRIKPGTLLFVVREHRPGVPIWITHAGIVFEGADGAPILRHATKRPPVPSVRDEPLARVLARLGHEHWPVYGVALFEPIPARWP